MDKRKFVNDVVEKANELLDENGWGSRVSLDGYRDYGDTLYIDFDIHYRGEMYSDTIEVEVDSINEDKIEEAAYSMKESASFYEDNSDEYDEYDDDYDGYDYDDDDEWEGW